MEFSAAGTTRTPCTDRTEQRAKRHSKQVGACHPDPCMFGYRDNKKSAKCQISDLQKFL